MKFMKKIILVFIAIFISYTSISAERELLFHTGVYGSYLHNFHLPDFTKLPNVPSCCPHYYNTGTGAGFSLGILFDFDVYNKFKLGLRAGISSLNGEITEQENIGNYTVRNTQGKEYIASVTVDHTLSASLYQMDFEPVISYYPVQDLFFTGGLKFGYMFSGNYSQEERLTSPENVVFLDGKVTRNNDIQNEPLPDKEALQVHASIGAGYRLEIGKNTYLTPEIKYYFPFTNITSVNWKVMSLSFGASLNLPIYESPKIQYYRDTTIQRDTISKIVMGLPKEIITLIGTDDSEAYKITKTDTIMERQIIKEHYERSVPREADLKLALTATGVTKDGTRKENPEIVIEELEESELFPLLPQIFFEKGKSEIGQIQQKMITADQSFKFSEDSLKWNTLDIYSNFLNIVGSRLNENPKATITITGCNNNTAEEKNNIELSKARAEKIKTYLTTVWGIDAKRIKTESRNLPLAPSNVKIEDGLQENQRVELSSTSPEILKPVTLRQITRTSNPPLVEINPTVFSEAELKSWRVDITQDNRLLREFSGKDVPSVLQWKVEDKPIPAVETPVTITLSAINEYSKKVTAYQDLTIHQKTIKKKREEIKDDKIVEKFSLIVFDFDKANLTKSQSVIMEQIKTRIKPNSKVIISGYTDRTGESEYNKALAEKRCREVQKFLEVDEANLTINPVGSDELLYNNDLPEGRSYSRTVKIIIETPVK